MIYFAMLNGIYTLSWLTDGEFFTRTLSAVNTMPLKKLHFHSLASILKSEAGTLPVIIDWRQQSMFDGLLETLTAVNCPSSDQASACVDKMTRNQCE